MNVYGVLDVDSEFYNYFDEIDKEFLTKICNIISIKF
jgi:putative methionine-R-sulfoxide reductase with GAF domain